jgi:hypothetical protein
MVAGRTVGGLVHHETIKEIEGDLTKVVEDFDRAVDVEALRLAKKNGKHSVSLPGDSSLSVASCRARFFAYAA